MTTLATRIERATTEGGCITFVGSDSSSTDRVEWAQLHDDARGFAARLQARGVAPGTHVALLGPTTRPLVTAIQATWLAGATVIVLPLPMRLASIEEFIAQTRARVIAADAALVVLDDELAPFLEPRAGDPPFVLLSELAPAPGRPTASNFERPPADPSSLAILQFTSGSTAEPKGVMLPHDRVVANLDAAQIATTLNPAEDVLVSWLPLYHDMGLIGLLTLPMITGTDLVLAGAQDFMTAPARWMEWMSDFRGTATAGPNFAYALAARALSRLDGLDLSRWRVGLNGAEPIDPSTVEAFCAAGARHGLNPGAVFCAFGMAEVTIAGTFPVPGEGMIVDSIDRRVLETDRYAAPRSGGDGTRRLARLGKPVKGLHIRIVDPETGRSMREREVGELEIKGTSVTTGYYRRPTETARAFRDGWLRTGDLAYLVDGELVVCGRIKDVIIVGGRNVFPEDVERAVASVEGVRAGNIIAFGVEGRQGREAVVVVAESKADGIGAVRDEVSKRVRSAVGVPPRDVVLVSPGTLPKTSSGKLQRALCRSRYLSAQLEPIGT